MGLAAMASAQAVRAEPTLTVEGSPRFFAGEPARRRITGTAEASAQTTWHVVVHGAEVARGGLESADSGRPPTLALQMPAVTRRMPADLLVRVGGRAAARVAIEIVPDPTDELAAAAGGDGVGWVGPAGSVPPRLARSGLRIDELPTADALAAYGGSLLVVASGAWDARRLVAPILARVRDGARVVAFGPDDAPWVDAAAAGALEPLDRSLVDGWGREPLASWGEDGQVARGSLRPPAGNHLELVPGRIRETYVGRGTLTLVRLAVLEHVEDEPFAVALLARLLARARRDPPVLEPPRAVLGDESGALTPLLGAARGTGPEIAWEGGPPGPADPAVAAPRLVVGRRESVWFTRKGPRSGPGLDDEPALLRFLTDAGVRVVPDPPWSAP